VEGGARFHHDRIRRRHSEDAFLLIGGEPQLVGSPTVLTTRNQAESFALALHATDELSFAGLTLTPGLRLELIASSYDDHLARAAGNTEASSERTLSVLLPGVGAYYALTPAFGVLAGVHRGMSPPAPGSSSDVEPEISINYEAGARFAQGFRRLEVIGYFNDYQNLTDVCTLSGGCDEQNLDTQFDAGRARIYGLEAFAEDSLIFGPARLPLSLSYTLTITEFLESFQSQDPIFGDVETGDELPYVPRHQGRASVGLELGAAGGYVAATYVGRMREQSGAGPLDLSLATEALLTLDVGAHYQLLDSLRLYAQARNLLDEQVISSRRPYGARPNAPRLIQLGLQLDLD
jgi:Fe(3+) dicitrate transport protein